MPCDCAAYNALPPRTHIDHSLCDPLVCRVAAIDVRLLDAVRNPRADHEDNEPERTGDEDT